MFHLKPFLTREKQSKKVISEVQTCLNILETGSNPLVIFEKSLNILDKSSTLNSQNKKEGAF